MYENFEVICPVAEPESVEEGKFTPTFKNVAKGVTEKCNKNVFVYVFTSQAGKL